MNYVQSLSKELEETKQDKEPALKIGAILSAAATVGVVIAQFFPQLDNRVVNIIALAFVVLVPLLTSWAIRKKVWSPATVDLFTQIKVDDATKAERLKNTSLGSYRNIAEAEFVVTDKTITKTRSGHNHWPLHLCGADCPNFVGK